LLARVCKVKQWLIDAYKSLVLEKTGSDLLELGDNGIDASTIARLFFIREQFKPQDSTVSYSYCTHCRRNTNFGHAIPAGDPQQLLDKINEVFASEFTGMEASSLIYSNEILKLTLAFAFQCEVK
jgi:hypothetical protein